MNKPKYTAKYFWKSIPDWKKKKDPVLSQIFYRPLSCVTASIAANLGISANAVSYFSGMLAVIACFLFLIPQPWARVLGAVLINVWLLLDCTDGNLARSYKKQLFGEFADGISSYILVGLMCTCMSVAVFDTGGVLVPAGSVWIIVVGALASSADTMMRLIYQKFKATAADHQKEGTLPEQEDERTDHSKVGSLRVRLESELGIGGILPIAILIATLFHALDLIVIYCFVYYGGACAISSLMQIRRAIRLTKEYTR